MQKLVLDAGLDLTVDLGKILQVMNCVVKAHIAAVDLLYAAAASTLPVQVQMLAGGLVRCKERGHNVLVYMDSRNGLNGQATEEIDRVYQLVSNDVPAILVKGANRKSFYEDAGRVPQGASCQMVNGRPFCASWKLQPHRLFQAER